VKATIGEKLEIEAANQLVDEATPPLSEKTSHVNATNYDRRDADRTKVDA
jgi:hypothetical protein